MPNTSRKSGFPTDTGNSPTATAVATISNGQVTEVTLTSGGFNYTSTPNVTLTGGGGVGAYVVAKVIDGSVASFNVSNPGRGYTSTPTVNISLDGGPALLTYNILTNPDPLQVPADNAQTSTLTLVVSNSGSVTVDVTSIALTLPGPSENAQDLTDSFTNIGVQVPNNGTNPLWTVSQDGGTFTLTPVSPSDGQIGAGGLSFIFSNILVNQSVGSCIATVAEVASSLAQPVGIRNAPPIELEKWPIQFSISTPTANPLEVNYNGSTEIAWSVTGQGVSTRLMYDPDGNGIQSFPESNVGSKLVSNLTNPSGVHFTVQATVPDPGHSQPMVSQQQVFVAVIPAPVIDFSILANPITSGQPLTFTLSWNLVDVSGFQITSNDGPNGNTEVLPVPFSVQGSYIVEPHRPNVIYTLQVSSSSDAGSTNNFPKEKKNDHHAQRHHHS